MLRLVIFVCMMSLVYGVINITSHPAKVINGNPVKLICDVGTMENTVKWVYEGVTYFSCDPPFTNCFTNSTSTQDGFFDFSINENSLIAMFLVYKDQNDGIWSCFHGSEEKDFKIDNGDMDVIESVSMNAYSQRVNFEVESKTPVDVLIYAISYKGKTEIYRDNQTNKLEHRFTPTLPCMYHIVYCKVTNGYDVKFDITSISVKCPLKILYDLSPKTTFILNDTFSSKVLKILHFEGYPVPDLYLYRTDANGIYRIYTGDFQPIDLDTYYSMVTEPAYVYVQFNNYDEVEAGKYILILRQGNITESFHFNFIYSTINIDKENTTDVPVDKNKDGSKNYLGVAAFVLVLLMVMGLVAVGVFWFIRIKRKPAGSKDKVYSTKDYKTTTPNEIYENME